MAKVGKRSVTVSLAVNEQTSEYSSTEVATQKLVIPLPADKDKVASVTANSIAALVANVEIFRGVLPVEVIEADATLA